MFLLVSLSFLNDEKQYYHETICRAPSPPIRLRLHEVDPVQNANEALSSSAKDTGFLWAE
jgi:hypothetical protein